MTRVITDTASKERRIVKLYGAAPSAFRSRLDCGEIALAAAVLASGLATAAHEFKTPIAHCAFALSLGAAGAADRVFNHYRIAAREPEMVTKARNSSSRHLSASDLSAPNAGARDA